MPGMTAQLNDGPPGPSVRTTKGAASPQNIEDARAFVYF